jgi:hypothetical protein
MCGDNQWQGAWVLLGRAMNVRASASRSKAQGICGSLQVASGHHAPAAQRRQQQGRRLLARTPVRPLVGPLGARGEGWTRRNCQHLGQTPSYQSP